ncbi:protoporphyrinogen oxidase [Porphyromonas macacae]|uniref:Coproporphyrinogen III oxidase n=1 Tax=Porphyromonas macacae TaxID=28115 RepID=A0A379DGS6_9PORP|nr:protoporphyrinogen oxidase [Porphyromonas macacae]SUB77546.1 Protoporphyrinogen oxidase [Porphyromonas macacae]
MHSPSKVNTLIIGAGLTGLSAASVLKHNGVDLLVLEAENRTGGQIDTVKQDGFVFETGPNTGTLSTPEVMELFELLGNGFMPETASADAGVRLIWKGERFNPLPSSLFSAIGTPLFRFRDKLRILSEPFRRRGTNPDESVADLVKRRLGKSFLDYAVDPFIGGIYAGNPNRLVTRYALPKLYHLEQTYGSFIRGAVAKAGQPKSDRDKKATKKVFSVPGGFMELINRMVQYVGEENIRTSMTVTCIESYSGKGGGLLVSFLDSAGHPYQIIATNVISSVPAYRLPGMLPKARPADLRPFENLVYAPIIEVAIGFKKIPPYRYRAFGGLVPSCERRRILGILFPSDCFAGRAPEGGALYTVFMGGIRRPEMLDKTDEEIRDIALSELRAMLGLDGSIEPDLFHIARYTHAIAQYYADSGERLEAVKRIQSAFPGLYIGGSVSDGIGMAHRITQAMNIANQIIQK